MRALTGIRVLDLSRRYPGAYTAMFLGDFGAEVIRVESVDNMADRLSGPFPDNKPGEEWWNEGGSFAYFSRNKESLCLEVRHPRGKAVFLKLIE